MNTNNPPQKDSQQCTENLQTLISMGFSSEQCRHALAASKGDLNVSINLLLRGESSGEGEIQGFESSTMIQIELSQYSFSEGSSACSSISLAFASAFLNAIDQTTSCNDVITSSFLQASVLSGIEKYQMLGMGEGIPQHKSPEEILNALPDAFAVQTCGGVRQGVLTSDEGPLGLKQTLSSCRDSNDIGWMAVVLTKPPETVCVCLPPKTETNSVLKNYILLDSHPRHQFASYGCYAMFHSSLDHLNQSLKLIFPQTDVGGSVMAEMYNSFDAYPLQKSM